MNGLEVSPSDRYLMIFVWKVGVFDAKLRFITRETCGSITRINDKRIAVLFITGFQNHRSQRLLSQENDKYGDLLAFNVPVKARTADSHLMLAAFRWIAETFSDLVEFVVTTHNNGLMPFIPAIVDFVHRGDITRDMIYCSSVKRPAPRPSDPQLPDYIKATSYNSSYFPSHCQSDLVILKTEMVSKIYEFGKKTKTAIIPPEIYLWGVLREKLRGNIAKNIVNYEELMKESLTNLLSYPLDYKHYEAISEAREMWEVMKSEFTAEHREKSNSKIRITYSRTLYNEEDDDDLIGKESKQFINKWSRL